VRSPDNNNNYYYYYYYMPLFSTGEVDVRQFGEICYYYNCNYKATTKQQLQIVVFY